MTLPLDYVHGIDYGTTVLDIDDTDSIAESESDGEITDTPAIGLANSLYSAAKRFDKQLSLFSQEKVYLHTDKPYYISGERIWFRAHVVDAASHLPEFLSNSVYVELFDSGDSIISRVKTGLYADSFSGYLVIPEDVPEGDYTIRCYTNSMMALSEDYFF